MRAALAVRLPAVAAGLARAREAGVVGREGDPWFNGETSPCRGSMARRRRSPGLGNRVVDRDTGTFVQDLDAEDLRSAHSAVFVGTRQGDIEGQHLVAVAGDAGAHSLLRSVMAAFRAG